MTSYRSKAARARALARQLADQARAMARLVRTAKSASRSPFSFERLVDEIAARHPLLWSVREDTCELGVLARHLGDVVAMLVGFAEAHRLTISLDADGTRLRVMGRLSSRQMWILAGAERVGVELSTRDYPVLDLGLYVYRERRDVLVHGGAAMMETLPPAISRRLLEGATGQWSAAALLGGEPRSPQPIDIVYTWVDGRDAGWQAMYREAFGRAPDLDRFGSRDELRYSLRSVYAYCGWYRKIFIVSNCAPPAWLDPRHEDLVWVDHADIIPEAHRPTFNSHAIEACLADIEDLSDLFIYFNDDFFVTRALRREHFFDAAGRSHSFLEPSGKLVEGRRTAAEEPWFGARLNAQRLLLERHGYAATRMTHHAPYAVNRHHWLRMADAYADVVERNVASRLRSHGDVPLIAFLYPHYVLAEGLGVARAVEAQQLRLSNVAEFRLDRQASFLCINDGSGSGDSEPFDRVARTLMQRRFPFAAPWEIG